MPTSVNSCRTIARHVVIASMVAATLAARVATATHPGRPTQIDTTPAATTTVQVARGKPRPVVDAVGWVVGIPGKILFWNARINNHDVSPACEAKVCEYAAYRNLHDVQIRVNDYAPLDEWRRLRSNKQVGAGWRYTFGVWHWLGYTVFPGRIWGGDGYNPYTNSIYVYSDVPSIAVSEAAYAADVRGRKRPGTYAFTQEFAGLDMWHRTIALKATVAYLHQYGTPDERREAYRVLYPIYGHAAGSSVDSWVGFGPIGALSGLLAGHTAGRAAARRVVDLPHPRPAIAPAAEFEPLVPADLEVPADVYGETVPPATE